VNFSVIFDQKFFKFILVGIINTIVGSAIMFSLYNLANWGYWQSSAANYIAGSILSFFLNKYFTFAVKEWRLAMVIAFIANIVFCYFIAYGAAKPLVKYLLQNQPQNISENIALFVGMCLFVGLNYLGQRFVVFKKRGENEF
jgi:putative flippase GtrA